MPFQIPDSTSRTRDVSRRIQLSCRCARPAHSLPADNKDRSSSRPLLQREILVVEEGTKQVAHSQPDWSECQGVRCIK